MSAWRTFSGWVQNQHEKLLRNRFIRKPDNESLCRLLVFIINNNHQFPIQDTKLTLELLKNIRGFSKLRQNNKFLNPE